LKKRSSQLLREKGGDSPKRITDRKKKLPGANQWQGVVSRRGGRREMSTLQETSQGKNLKMEKEAVTKFWLGNRQRKKKKS